MIRLIKLKSLKHGFGFGILISWDNFKGISILIGKITIDIGKKRIWMKKKITPYKKAVEVNGRNITIPCFIEERDLFERGSELQGFAYNLWKMDSRQDPFSHKLIIYPPPVIGMKVVSVRPMINFFRKLYGIIVYLENERDFNK